MHYKEDTRVTGDPVGLRQAEEMFLILAGPVPLPSQLA